MKIGKKWLRMAPVYYRFAIDSERLDWSEKAAQEAYLLESQGVGKKNIGLFEQNKNGYVLGKKYMDATIKMWLEDLDKCLLWPRELYQDFRGFEWFLDKTIGHHPRVKAYRT